MNIKLPSLLLSFFLSLAILITPTKSQAAVGLVASGGVAILGLAMAGGSVVTFGVAATIASGSSCGDCAGAAIGFLGILLLIPFVLGLLLLDGEEGQQVAFSTLDLEQAAEIGVTKSELKIYNSEIDEANMLMAQVTQELAVQEDASPEQAKKLWDELSDSVAPATFKVMQKIAQQEK